MSLSKKQVMKVKTALSQHLRMENSYFWTPYSDARGRRYEEAKNTFSVKFRHSGHIYAYHSDVSCSCRNYFYTGKFMLDGEQKNVRLFKNLLTRGELDDI
jgi:hypothetical protein